MPRSIGSLGSVALLVSSITGPSLVVIPLLFQQAGWLTPLLTFALTALLSGAAALFVVEAMSSIEGNEAFQASIEFTTIAHLFLGKKWHVIIQGLLYLAMQTLVIASLLESFQTMDAFLVSVAHKTCAISFTGGWVCVNQIPPNASSAFSGYILGSFGTLVTMSLILPLSLVHLVDNIIFQVASFIILLIITLTWIIIFAVTGLHNNHIPVVGRDQSTVVGFVLSNFSFVTTIPAWVNNTHPSVNIRLVVWVSILVSCLIYVPIGWMGGSAFVLPNNTTLLQVFATDARRGILSTVARVSSYVFPLAVLVTSVPVFTIVIRYNLLRGNICSYKMAIFWSALVPWLIAIPFQTNGGLATILNWASLVFTSPSNLMVPFILLIASKRYQASAVLDANISPGIPRGSEGETPLVILGPTAARERGTAPVENIPVVIVTDSTDVTPPSIDEVKMFVSSEEAGRSSLAAIPMPVRNRVSSPSKHRYYGQKVRGEEGEYPTSASGMDLPVLLVDTSGEAAAEDHDRPRPSLSLSLSHSHSITHSSNTGMDEFLLLSPVSPASQSHTVRSVLSEHSSRQSISTDLGSTDTNNTCVPDGDQPSTLPQSADVRISISTLDGAIDEPVQVFKAFPYLPLTSPMWSTRISAIGCSLASAMVLTAIVYNIVQSASRASPHS